MPERNIHQQLFHPQDNGVQLRKCPPMISLLLLCHNLFITLFPAASKIRPRFPFLIYLIASQQIIEFEMFLKKFVREFVLRSDMFAASTNLRYRGQSSYETLFGGCFSILLVITFTIIFYTSFYEVITKVNITSTLETQNDMYSTNQITGLQLAIGIEGMDFSQSQRYFGLELMEKTMNKQTHGVTLRSVNLQPCQKNNWKDEGPNFDLLFSVFSMSNMLCPISDEELILKGFAGSDEWISYYVLVEQCRNGTSPSWTCYDQATIDAFFTAHFVTNDYFKVQIYIVDTIISPSQEDPITKQIEQQIFVTFSENSGSRGKVKIGEYNVTTDDSIWPNSDISYEEGYYITDHRTNSIELFSTHYVKMEITKDSTVFTVIREHDKLDDMLSYVGGLFSLLFAFIYFFLGSYNQYKYQIAVAEGAFAMDETGIKMREKNFGFFRYLQYCIYDWLKTFNIKVNWARMQDIDAARQEATEQMDVQYLIKKVQRFELMNKYLMGEHNLICANLSRPPTLEQVKRMRKITQFYDKIIKVQNEEQVLQGILSLVNKNDNRVTNDEKMSPDEQDSDYDSEDQAAEMAISESLDILEKEQGQSPLTKQILNAVPPKIVHRLRQQRAQALVQKKLLVIESMDQESMEQVTSPQNMFASFFAKK